MSETAHSGICMSFMVFLFSPKQGVWSWQQTISIFVFINISRRHSFSENTVGEFPVSDPIRRGPSQEIISWVSPVSSREIMLFIEKNLKGRSIIISNVSSLKILCFENIGSGLPGFTFLECYARTYARMQTYTHAQIRT